MKWLIAGVLSIAVLQVSALPSRACGIKLTIKSAPPRTAAARRPDAAKPVRSDQSRDVVAARAKRKPIAAGPEHTSDRELIAAKPPAPPTPPPDTSDTATDKPAASAPTDTAPAPTPEHVTTDRAVEPEVAQTPAKTVKPLETDAVLAQVYFSLGSSSVAHHAALDRVARKLTSHPDARARIEGYADPTGTPEGNMALSQQRAEAVRDYLVDKGIDTSRLDVKAFGDTILKFSRTDGRNRHVAVVVE